MTTPTTIRFSLAAAQDALARSDDGIARLLGRLDADQLQIEGAAA